MKKLLFLGILLLTSVFLEVNIEAQIGRGIRLQRASPPPDCSYSIMPTSANVVAAGQNGISSSVDTQVGCAWTSTSNNAWITVTSGANSNGDGNTTFNVAPNTGVARVGTVTIAGHIFTVTQDEEEVIPPDPEDEYLVGAIRFDAWDPNTSEPLELDHLVRLENDTNIRWRVPYFTNVAGHPGNVDINENLQAVVDQDILYASAAGIDYWAIDHYCIRGHYTIDLQKTSPYRNLMKYALTESSPTQCRVDQVLAEVQDSQYLTILDGRPVVFFFQYEVNGGTPATMASLRQNIVNVTGKNPYFVAMNFTAASAAALITVSGFGYDALSSYGGGLECNSGVDIPYSSQVNCEQTQWTQYRNTGFNYVPTVTTGWETLVAGTNPGHEYPSGTFTTLEATPTEIANHLTAAIASHIANPNSNPGNLILISAWNEYTEGHFLSPYHTTTNATGAGRLTAIGAVLNTEGCTYSISPTSESSPSSGETGVDSAIDTQVGCAWTATSNAGFITITSGASGTGDGTTIMTVAANGGAFRSGTVTIAGRTFTVNQGGASSGSIISEGDLDRSWCGQANCFATLPGALPDGSWTFSLQPGATGGYTRNEGLTQRCISGTCYFISTADSVNFVGYQGEPYTFSCNFIAGTCIINDTHGNIYGDKRPTTDGSPYLSHAAGPIAIHWHEPTSNLYWSYSAHDYGDGFGTEPCLGRSTLSSGGGNGIASYRFETIPFARCSGPIVPIPPAHQGSFGGNEFFLFNNGYHSGTTSDIALHGIAINLPTGTHLSSVANTKVTAHTWDPVQGEMDVRPAWLSAYGSGVNTLFGHWGANNLSDWTDYRHPCIFPDNGVHFGILCPSTWTLGGVSYISATTGGHGNRTGIDVYDPADFALVFNQTNPTYSPKPVPTSQWEILWNGWDYSKPPFQLYTRTVDSVSGVAATKVFTFTFTSAHGLNAQDKFTAYGSANPNVMTASGGFTVLAVINSTQLYACTGQDSGENFDCTDFGSDVTIPDFTENTNFDVVRAAFGKTFGRIAGALWMKDAPNACSVTLNNMMAFIYDAADLIGETGNFDEGSKRRIIECIRLN